MAGDASLPSIELMRPMPGDVALVGLAIALIIEYQSLEGSHFVAFPEWSKWSLSGKKDRMPSIEDRKRNNWTIVETAKEFSGCDTRVVFPG